MFSCIFIEYKMFLEKMEKNIKTTKIEYNKKIFFNYWCLYFQR